MALFWEHREFQDRAVRLWETLAARYKGNTWVAGYNPLNEPTDEEHTRVLEWYERVEKAIRKIDPDHILYWDGNTVRIRCVFMLVEGKRMLIFVVFAVVGCRFLAVRIPTLAGHLSFSDCPTKLQRSAPQLSLCHPRLFELWIPNGRSLQGVFRVHNSSIPRC